MFMQLLLFSHNEPVKTARAEPEVAYHNLDVINETYPYPFMLVKVSETLVACDF